MFWNKRKKCPITNEDQNWIREKLQWINDELFSLESKETILPTKKYFNYKFKNIEKDAEFVLNEVGKYFNTDVSNIELDFYSEEPLELDRGLLTETIDGKGSAGMYSQGGGKFYIDIEVQQLARPESLIATIAHELSHYVLIGQNSIFEETEENEWLTDLFTIANGFGIFMGNSRFEFNKWESGDGWSGWEYNIQGYLPQQIIGYTMAEIEMKKSKEIPKWTKFMKDDFKKDFIRSMKYLIHST